MAGFVTTKVESLEDMVNGSQMGLGEDLEKMEKQSHAGRKGHSRKMFGYDATLIVGSKKVDKGTWDLLENFSRGVRDKTRVFLARGGLGRRLNRSSACYPRV